MRALEFAAVEAGATWSDLMEQAGWGIAQALMRRMGSMAGQPLVALIGPGNNGGDGLVAARHLHDAGALVTLYVWHRSAEGDQNWQLCRARGIAECMAADDAGSARLHELLAGASLVLDALLGAGISRPVSGDLAVIIELVNQSKRSNDQSPEHRPLVVAIDLPSGIDADSGAVHGVAIQADVTIATGLAKRGHWQQPGRAYCGQIEVVDIGLTQALVEGIMTELIDARRAATLLPARPADSYKGSFGKVMVVAGSTLYPGAAALSTAAAARVGAGLVTLANARGIIAGIARLPEITLRPLPEAEPGLIGEAAADELLTHLAGYSVLLLGPGLGHEKPTRRFIERLLGIDAPRHRGQIGFRVAGATDAYGDADAKRAELPPLVLDADALNILSEIDHWWERLPRERCVLTPHPGEMKRLLKAEELPEDRVKTAADAATAWGQVVVLKGASTVVARPGAALLNDGANPALATAGTGDVLAGAIAGLIAQGLAPFEAAALGVYLHSAAGRLVRDEFGDAGALASDLLPRLPLAIKGLR